ncbi:MAG TPA: hypothetical protein VJX67_24320, partial [Blastocatellia bacterium]|nr:hypothetical protein [Blastocatellia bacterium]
MDSQAGLVVQWAGITLIVVLSFFVRRSAKRTSVAYWACGWLCLAIALGSLELAFRSPHFRRILTAVYFFGEYSFGYLFISGCRNWATGAVLNRRSWSLAGAGAATAVGLTFVSGNFDIEFIPHAAIVAGLFGSAFFALHRARLGRETGLGLRVMSIALLLLTLDFLHYVPVFGYAVLFHVQPPFGYLRYTSIYDLILEILLGFGTVMLVMEAAQEEIAAANRELTAARDRLEVLARRDPLTEALN